MSFAADVKNELAHMVVENACCRKAELSGLLRMGAVITLGARRSLGLSFTTENAAVARRALVLLKELGVVRTEITVSRSRRLKKNNSYTVRALPGPEMEGLLKELGMTSDTMPTAAHTGTMLRRPCCRAAYLRGAFLGGGSVNRPEAEYHLELVTQNYQFAELLTALLKRFELPVGLTDRKGTYIVYLKEGDAIVELLTMMEAVTAVENFESARNLKEVRNQVNRLVNCETANLQKTANAAGKQLACIQKLAAQGRLAGLSPALRETAEARLKHAGASLTELAELLGVGRSGINHRLRKLTQLAEEIEEA